MEYSPQLDAHNGKMLVCKSATGVVFFTASEVVNDRIELRIKFVFHACALCKVFAVCCKQV